MYLYFLSLLILRLDLIQFYLSILFIIAGIDKENIKIEKSVLIFGFIIELLYIIYQYTLDNSSVYQYVMYLIIFVIILLILRKILKSNKNKQYIFQNFYLSLYMFIFSGIEIYILTFVLSLIILLFYKSTKSEKENQLPFGFYLSISNILLIAILNIIINYVI